VKFKDRNIEIHEEHGLRNMERDDRERERKNKSWNFGFSYEEMAARRKRWRCMREQHLLVSNRTNVHQ